MGILTPMRTERGFVLVDGTGIPRYDKNVCVAIFPNARDAIKAQGRLRKSEPDVVWYVAPLIAIWNAP